MEVESPHLVAGERAMYVGIGAEGEDACATTSNDQIDARGLHRFAYLSSAADLALRKAHGLWPGENRQRVHSDHGELRAFLDGRRRRQMPLALTREQLANLGRKVLLEQQHVAHQLVERLDRDERRLDTRHRRLP